MDSLKSENFDLVIVENFDYCPFLVAEKLGKPFVSILSSSFGAMDFGLPNPLSYEIGRASCRERVFRSV